MICKICGKEFKSNKGFGSHIKQTHNIDTKIYYDTYMKKENEDICICGNKTRFINVINGYAKHCSLKCAHNDENTKIKRRKTNLKKYGNEHVLASPIIKEKCKKTCKELYGNEEIFKTQHFKEEYKKTSLEHFGVEHHTKQHKNNKTKPIIQKQSKSKELSNSTKKEISKTIKNTKNTKIINKKSIKNVENKSLEINYQKPHNRIRYYEYDNLIFDSSWELATYIWHKDHNINIIREPCTFEYIGLDFKKHTYFPDFQINNQIIEVKGNQYLKPNGKLKDEAKQICIEDNNVIIWSYNDIKPYIQYCEELFNDKYWYKAFKYNTNYKPVHCKHTKLIETSIKCLICNKTFQNGQYLSAHLKFEERIKGQDYYDSYLKQPQEGYCIVCNKPTKYINFTRGYQLCCSRECAAIEKGKKISKTKQSFTKEQKQCIKEKRENTCLERYGVKSNLQIPELVEKNHSKEVRQKAKETRKKHLKELKER